MCAKDAEEAEGFGITQLEASACGKPLIGRKSGESFLRRKFNWKKVAERILNGTENA